MATVAQRQDAISSICSDWRSLDELKAELVTAETESEQETVRRKIKLVKFRIRHHYHELYPEVTDVWIDQEFAGKGI